MKSHFSSQFFSNNRKRLKDLYSEGDLVVIVSNGLVQRNADTTYPFSQEANFWYLTGISEPDLVLVLEGENEYLIVPERSVSRQAFDGTITDNEVMKISGIKNVLGENEGWDLITRKLKKEKKAGVLGAPAAYMKAQGIYTNPTRSKLCRHLLKIEPKAELQALNEILRDLRMVKQPEELRAIQSAIDITGEALKNTLEKSYKYEYELEAEITKGMRSKGASGHAYEPIVASGKRGCTLHYIDNDGKIEPNDLVVIDVGAEVEHYAADITRTVCVGTPSKRQKEVYKAVLEIHKYACSLLAEGVLLRDYERSVREFLGKKLVELGLIEEVAHEGIMKYYPHSTSHFLGLNVHDVGDYDAPLKAGMVITVEPGIYIAEESIGVRIEDDVLITENGIKNLSTKIPKSL